MGKSRGPHVLFKGSHRTKSLLLSRATEVISVVPKAPLLHPRLALRNPPQETQTKSRSIPPKARCLPKVFQAEVGISGLRQTPQRPNLRTRSPPKCPPFCTLLPSQNGWTPASLKNTCKNGCLNTSRTVNWISTRSEKHSIKPTTMTPHRSNVLSHSSPHSLGLSRSRSSTYPHLRLRPLLRHRPHSRPLHRKA